MKHKGAVFTKCVSNPYLHPAEGAFRRSYYSSPVEGHALYTIYRGITYEELDDLLSLTMAYNVEIHPMKLVS